MDSRALSDWDLHIYALRLYDDNLYPDRPVTAVQDGPRLYLPTTIRNHQAYQLWTWLRRSLRSDQLDQLWQAGRQIVVEEELNWVKDLPHPSVLESRL